MPFQRTLPAGAALALLALVFFALVSSAPAVAQSQQPPALCGLPLLPPCPQPVPPPTPKPRPTVDPNAVPNLERECGDAAGNGPPAQADPRGVNPGSPNPLAGLSFFVDPTEPSYHDMVRYSGAGQQQKASLISRLAQRPKGHWVGKFTRPNMPNKIRNFLNCVQVFQPGSVPLLMVLRHQGKACDKRYTAGGGAEDAATRRWYDDFVRAVGDSRVVIGFEPDSVGTIECLARSRRQARRDVLRYGVEALSKLPNATIYLEGTASDWKNARFTARVLNYIGIAKVRGFMLNVTHYDWTNNNIAYGNKVSSLTGGKPFVISTSYNGRGPVHYLSGKRRHKRRVNVFCNPRYRGLGPAPTANTGVAKVDAFLYMNRPGVSGAGACNGAPPKQGTWWPERGLMFSQYATELRGPPRGTRFGFPQRISLCRLGAPLKGMKKYSKVAPERRCKR
jgi:endoglucanase